jgi:hypothetical protein
MNATETASLSSLYLEDETAWLEATAQLIEEGRLAELDQHHLVEYLRDMARRDKREVQSRLSVLLAHLLKWDHQPERRTGGWRETIELQRQELHDLLESGILRNHAQEVLATVYVRGVRQAAAETGLAVETFPPACPFTLDEVLGENETPSHA